MIISFRPKIETGSSITNSQLLAAAQSIFPNPPDSHSTTMWNQNPQLGIFEHLAIYRCKPNSSTQAVFVWNNERDFEIIAFFFGNGDVFDSAAMIHSIITMNKSLLRTSEFTVTIKSPGTAQAVAIGENYKPVSFVYDLKLELISLAVLFLMIPISKVLIESFYEDAIAGYIGASILLLIRIIGSSWEKKSMENTLVWRVKE